MFTTSLTRIPPFDQDAYIQAASFIGGNQFNNDDTMVITLRALLFDRLEGHRFRYHFNSVQIGEDLISQHFDTIFPVTGEYSLSVTQLSGEENNISTCIEKLEHMEGFVIQKDVAVFVNSCFHLKCVCMINDEKNQCCIAVQNLNMSAYHCIQAFIKRYFPSLYAKRPEEEDEKKLYMSLAAYSAGEYRTRIEQIAKRKMKLDVLRIQTEDIYRRAREREYSDAEAKKELRLSEMLDQQRAYLEAVKEYEESLIRLEGLAKMIKQSKSTTELFDFLSSCPNLDVAKIDGTKLHIMVRTHLEYFEADAYHCLMDEEWFVEDTHGEGEFEDDTNKELLMDSIFSEDPTFKIKMCAYYILDIRGIGEAPASHQRQSGYENYVPNPHLSRHSCLGDYARHINCKLTEGDIVGAIEQCMASAASVNIEETEMTFQPMMETIFCSDKKILVTIDGTEVTPTEALALIRN